MTREEALKIVRENYPHFGTTEPWLDLEKALATLIPELAESEDEMIRKELIGMINECTNWEHKKEYISYLEKQKENPKTADSIPSNCTSDVKCEDRWHKVGDSLPDNGRLVLAKDCLGNVLLARYDGENWEVNVYDNEDHYCHNSISKWCEIPSEKQKEQKPLHWRRIEDATTQRTDDGCCVTSEKMLVKGWINDGDYRIVDEGTMVNRDILCIPVRELNAEQKPISFYGHYNPDDYEVVIEGNATSLKKKEQKPAEWSEEDEKYLNRVINLWVNDFGEDSDTVKWLKSLRPSWKPSEDELAKKHLDGYCMGREDTLREMKDFVESHFNCENAKKGTPIVYNTQSGTSTLKAEG